MEQSLYLRFKIKVYWLIITLPKNITYKLFYQFCMLLPLQNKVVATTFKGKKYGDNPQHIYEKLHEKYPFIKLLWMCSTDKFSLPEWIGKIPLKLSLCSIYHLATAKVYIDTHRFQTWYKKRPGQLFVETWHGGLGIKKMEMDVPVFAKNIGLMAEVNHTCKLADVFVSQSDHLSQIYRRAFGYTGPIWKCGYPKNDSLFVNRENAKKSARDFFLIPSNSCIFLYAPTFRDYFYQNVDISVYNVDFAAIKKVLQQKFGGSWVILVRWHPLFANQLNECCDDYQDVINATSFPDIQELLKASDMVLSDYSSCLFDAALLDIPCFTYATDFDIYKKERGAYYEMEELPFPYAQDNQQLVANIHNYDYDTYLKKWKSFKQRMGLYEPGNASDVIAKKIVDFMQTGRVEWN